MASLSRTVSEASGSHISESSIPISLETLEEKDDDSIKEAVKQLE